MQVSAASKALLYICAAPVEYIVQCFLPRDTLPNNYIFSTNFVQEFSAGLAEKQLSVCSSSTRTFLIVFSAKQRFWAADKRLS